MKKLIFPVACSVCLSFILWVLPLGVFIKPFQEKLVCDGQRAMCMCHVMMPPSSDKAMESGMALKTGSSSSKENTSGGGSNYFVSAKSGVTLGLKPASFFENQYLCYKSPFLAVLEYVPKV